MERLTHTYPAQKDHEKKILARAKKMPWAELPEALIEVACDSLHVLKDRTTLKKAIKTARRRFPGNPVFVLAELEQLLAGKVFYLREQRQAQKLLQQAHRLTEAIPRGTMQEALLARIRDIEDELQHKGQAARATSFPSFMDHLFDQFLNGGSR